MGKGITEIKETLFKRNQEGPYHKNSDIELLSERITQIVIEEVNKFLSKKSI